jgi:hypothetical protein
MGCPDWPNALGIISHQQSNKITVRCWKEYDKGQLIRKSLLLVAKMILYRSHLSTRTTGKNTRNMIMLFLIQSILGLNTSIAY